MLPVLLMLLCADPSPDPTPRFKVKTDRDAVRVEPKLEKGVVVWEASAVRGIGGADIELTAGEAPKKVIVRFRGLTNLENFSLEHGKLRVSASLPRGPTRTLYLDETGNEARGPDTVAATVLIDRGRDGVEATLTFKKPGTKWRLSWIRVYLK